MIQSECNNRRIAINTIFLYVRTIIVLGLSLYTSRVILKVLGEEDFGIYNVVGGVIVLFSFLTNALTASTQRYLNYNMGLNDSKKISLTFDVALVAHISITIFFLILAETIGLWFVQTQLNIPIERQNAAIWVYHFTIIATAINILVIPYRSSIIATEKMSQFALFSIIEAVFKFVIVLILPYIKLDSLILYSLLMVFVSILLLLMYYLSCRNQLFFTKFNFEWDYGLYKEMLSFSGWYLFGGAAIVGARQGGNILLNIFKNVSINAAVGIANQVRAAVVNFVSSFQTAFTPQIVKLCASGEQSKLLELLYRSTKFSFVLYVIIAVPVIFFCDSILNLWLYEVPAHAVLFTQLVVITTSFDVLSTPLWTSIGAIGDIRKYQIVVSLILLSILPLSYFALSLGWNSEIVFVLDLIANLLAFIYRVYFAKQYVGFNYAEYLKNALYPCLSILIIIIPLFYLISTLGINKYATFVEVMLGILAICLISFFVVFNESEKKGIIEMFKSKLKL